MGVAISSNDYIGTGRIHHVACRSLDFRQHVRAGSKIGDADLTVAVSGKNTVGGQCGRADYAVQAHLAASGGSNAELSARQGIAGIAVPLLDDELAFRLVFHSHADRLPSLNHDSLALGVDEEACGSAGFRDHYASAGNQPVNAHLTVLVTAVDAIGIAHQGAVRIGHLKFGVLEGHAGIDAAHLTDEEAAHGLVAELQGFGLVGVDLDRLGNLVQDIARAGSGFLDHQSGSRHKVRDQDGSRAVGGEVAVGISDHSAVRGGNEKLNITQRLAGHAVHLFDEHSAVLAVGEGEGDAVLLLAGDVGRLRRSIHDIPVGRGDFLHDIRPSVQPGDYNVAVAGGLILTDDRAAAAGGSAQVANPEPGVGQGCAGVGINLPNDQRRLGNVLEGDLHGGVVFNVDDLLGRLLEHETCGRFHLDDLIPPGVQVVQVDDAVGVGVEIIAGELLIGSILVLVLGNPNLELCALDPIANNGVHLVNGKTGLLLVLNADLGGLAGAQVDLVGRLIQNIPLRSLDLSDDVVPLCQMLLGHGNLTVGIDREVPDLHAGLGLDLENRASEALAVDVHLHDLQGGPLVVLELHLGLPVGEQGHSLGRGIKNIPLRDILLRDSVGAGQQVGDDDLAVCAGRLGGDGGAVRAPQRESHAGYGSAGVLVRLADDERGPLVIFQTDLRCLTREQLHMVLGFIQDVIRQGSDLLDGVHTGFQILHQNLAAVLGGAVQIPAAVLNPGDTEDHAIQRRTVRTGLNEPQAGLLCVRKHKFCRIVGPQVDDALSIVHHITGAFQFGHFVGAGGELAQVDFTVSIGDKFLGAEAAIDGPNAELHAGDGLGGIGAVHLDQLHAGLLIVEEKQILRAVSGNQFYLLPAGVQDVAVIAGIHLNGPVGSRCDTGQEDFPIGVRLVPADGSTVPVDLEGDALHGLVAGAVILHDPQANLGKILEHQGPGRDGVSVGVQLQLDLLHLGGGFIAGRGYDLRHGVLAGLDILPVLLGGVPPLDGLQFAVLIRVKLIVPVGDGGELEGGGADALVGHGIPLVQDRLARARAAAVLNARGGTHLDRARLGGVLRSLAGHGEGRVQRGTASGSLCLLDVQRHAAAVLHNVGDGRAGSTVRAGGHGGQHRAAAGGVGIDGEHRAGEGPLICRSDFLQLQIYWFLLCGGGSIGEGYLGFAAAAGKLLGGQICRTASAGDVGQIGGIVFCDLEPERGVRIEVNVHGFVRFQRELQPAAGVRNLAGAVHAVSLSREAPGRTGGVGHREAPGVRAGNCAAHLLGHIQRELVPGRSLKVEGAEDVQAIGAAVVENGVPDVAGGTDGVHKAIALGEAVGGVQLLAGRLAAAVQRVLQKLVILPLAHVLRHILDGRGLVVDQVVDLHGLVVVERVSHHLTQGVGAAVAVRVSEDAACFNDDPVLRPQIAVRVMDILRPVLQSNILAPAGEGLPVAAHLR